MPPAHWTALLPPLTAIALAFATRRVVIPLAVGVLVAGPALALRTGDLRDLDVISRFVVPAVASRSFALILLVYLACLGGMIGIWQRTGGARRFAERVGARLVRGPRSALAFAWICGVIFHQGGTVSCVLTGFTARPLADRHRVSHEELSFLVDATASPAAAVVPLNAWPALYAALLVGSAPPITSVADGLALYLRSIPFNVYSWSMLAAALLFALGWLPSGRRMRDAATRARRTGALDAGDARPLTRDRESLGEWPGYRADAADIVAPLATILAVAVGAYAITGSPRFELAFSLAVLVLAAVSARRGLPIAELARSFARGVRAMGFGAVVLGLAVTLGVAAQEVGTGELVVRAAGGAVPAALLPALVLGLAMAISFATGTSLGTAAVLVPAVLPLAHTLCPQPAYLALTVGAACGGAVFGDQTSPISDTTILASMFCGADLLHHVRSQLPIALGCAALSAVLTATAAAVLVG